MPNEERRDKIKSKKNTRIEQETWRKLEWSNIYGIGAPEMNETVRAPMIVFVFFL